MNSATKSYVAQFRIKELKSALDQLSLPTSGRKAELQARLGAYFGEPVPNNIFCNVEPAKEEWRLQAAEKIVYDIYYQWKVAPMAAGRASQPSPSPPPPQPEPQLQPPSNLRPSGTGAQPYSARQPHSTAQRLAQLAQSQQRTHNQAGVRLPPATTPTGATPAMQSARVEIIPAGNATSAADKRADSARGNSNINGRLAASGARSSTANSATVIRCVCNSNVDRGEMIQCEAEGCGVWQHIECVGVSPNAPPEHFYCELCRAAWADPFWEVKNARVLPPARLLPTGGPMMRGASGANEIQQVAEHTFNLTHTQLDLTKKSDQYQLQAVCLLLNDPVPFRFQWPRNAELRINGMSYRVYSRPPGGKVGNNLRDEPANLHSTAFVGRNRIRMQANDSRKFVVLVQLVKRRSIADITLLMAAPESLEQALQRVKRQVGSSEDDDLAIGSTVISLRDPLSGKRVAKPVRFQGSNGLVAFDQDTFLSMAQRSRKWQCPHSMRNTRVQELQPDTFLGHILEALKGSPDVMDVEVLPEGEWRPMTGGYPWVHVTDPLPQPALQPAEEEVAVKTEPGTAVGLADDDSEEELSEGEELRRAANAYASTSRPAVQEVIVLDDSSDEELRPAGLPRKRPATERAMQQHRGAAAAAQPRQQLLNLKLKHQPTIQYNLNASDRHRRANGAGAHPPAAVSNRANGNLFPLNQQTSSSSSGVSNAFSSDRNAEPQPAGVATAGPGSPVNTGHGRINIRLPSRAAAASADHLSPSHSFYHHPGPASASMAPTQAFGGYLPHSGSGAGDRYINTSSQWPHPAPSELGSLPVPLNSQEWGSTTLATALNPPPGSPPSRWLQLSGGGYPANGTATVPSIPAATSVEDPGADQLAGAASGSRPEVWPPLPPPPPPPGDLPALAEDGDWARGFTPSDHALLSELLRDDAMSNQGRSSPGSSGWQRQPLAHQSSTAAVIDLESD